MAFLIAGFDADKTPTIITWQIRLNKAGEVVPDREEVTQGTVGHLGGVALGWNERVKDFWQHDPRWAVEGLSEPAKIARELVHLEIDASEKDGRRDVGGPVSVVTLTYSSGFKSEDLGAPEIEQRP
jgi:hypothetical protein